MDKPKLVWNQEDECWEIQVGEYITVKFLEDNQVLVDGQLMTMEISVDQITEARGILFKQS